MRSIHLTLAAAFSVAMLAGCPATAPNAPEGNYTTLAAGKTIPVGKTPHGMWANGAFVYNSNVGESTISVIDTGSDTVVKTLNVPDGGVPGYIKATHDNKHMLVLDTQNGRLLVFDPAQDHKLLQSVAVGAKPDKLVIGADDQTVLVSLTGESKLVSLSFGADRAQAPTRKEYAVGANAGEHRALGFDAGWAVVPNAGDNTSSLVNLGTGAVSTVADGNNPGPVAIGSSDGAAVAAIVGNAASNTISIFDLPSGAKTTLSGVGLAPTEIAIDATLKRAFVTMAGSNEVAVIDYAAKTLLTKLPVGKRPVHIYMAPARSGEAVSHELWVGNDDGGSVTILNGETLTGKATVTVGQGHHKMALTSAKGYISNIKDNTVSVIDRATVQ